MSEIKPWGYLITEHETGNVVFTKHHPSLEDMQEYELTRTEIYTADQLAKAVLSRDLLINDLRKELNERRYGRSAAK